MPNYRPDDVPDDWRDLLLRIPGYDCIATATQDCWFNSDEAQRAIDFFPRFLRHVEGDIAGSPFALQEWQKAILACIFGWQRLDDKKRSVRRYREVLVFLPRGNGKALALDTPIPTPSGWTTMGEVKAGDILFDDNGQACTVEEAYPVMFGNTCYRVGFSDGTSIVADAEHLWETDSRMDRDRLKGQGGKNAGPKPSIKTTEQIRKTLYVERTLGHQYPEKNHRVRVALPLELPEQELPIDPYVLGAWLGDGDSDGSGLSYSIDDIEITELLAASGVCVSSGRRDPRNKVVAARISFVGEKDFCGRGHLKVENCNAKGRCLACERSTDHARRHKKPIPESHHRGFQATLRSEGLLGNKHIPAKYLRASFGQRLAMMQGLMDTDGYVSKEGQCEFTTTKPALRDGFLELARSLGFKPTLKTARATIYGKDCGEKYRIQFWSFRNLPAFRLSRKLARLKESPGDTRTKYRQIVSVEPVPSVPVRCIKVNSPSHLYLAGEGMIPTHNTCFVAGMCVYVLVCDGEPGAQIYGAAAEREQAALLFRQAKGMIEQEPKLDKRCKIYGGMGHRSITLRNDQSSSYRVLSADAFSKHGFNTHAAFIDELHALPNRDLVDVLKTSMGKANRKQPLMVYLTTSDFDRPSICNEKHDYAEKVKLGITDDPEFLPVVYQAERDDDWRDESVWAKANPNLGVSVSLDYLRSECKRAQEVPAYENTFRRLHLNQRTSTSEKCIPMEQWDACKEKISLDSFTGQECYAGIDIGATSDFTAMVLLFPHADVEIVEMPVMLADGRIDEREPAKAFTRRTYSLVPFFWLPQNPVKRDSKMQNQIDTWTRQGFIRRTHSKIVDYDQVLRDILEITAPFYLAGVLFDKGFQGVQFGTNLIGYLGEDRAQYYSQGILSMAPPFREFLELLAVGRIRQDGNPVMRWMASNTMGERRGGLMKPSKDKSGEKIDGITAACMAMAWAMSVGTVEAWIG